MDEDERKNLLWPPWATNGEGPRYEALDDAGKALWRQTRGQRTDGDTITTWAHKLSTAVQRNEITNDQAREAMQRVMHNGV